MLVHSGTPFAHLTAPQPSTTSTAAVTLEDLLDLDMFATPSSPSSRQSSPMPPSPQPGLSLPDPTVASTDSLWPSFFASASAKDIHQQQQVQLAQLSAMAATPPPPLFPATGSSQSIADFLSALSASTADLGVGGSGSSSIFTLPSMASATSPPTTTQPTTTSLPGITLSAPPSATSFTIDPQLTSPQTPSLDDIDEEDSEDDDEPMIMPVKVGGKSKSRKGTVAGGGVTKRTGGAGTFKDSTHEPEDWRPSPEEYKKLSSKEKRQLRNKISARNFRVRRKEYISTLEGDIAERDRLISAIREELGTSRLENVELRREVEALKKAMLEGRTGDALPPPGPITPTTGATVATGRTTRGLMPKVNTQKDVASSPRGNNTKSFWGGASMGNGGVTSVHTTLVPDFSAATLAGKPASRNAYVPSYAQQENINPFLNTPAYLAAVKAAAETDAAKRKEVGGNASGLEGFTDVNPFTLKTMDAYRMYLWTKMAREAGQAQRDRDLSHSSSSSSGSSSQGSSPSPSSAGSPASSGSSYGSLFTPASSPIISAANLKPQWLASPKSPSPTLAAILSGKASSSSSSSSSLSKFTAQQQQTAQTAMLAAMASQTLASRMGGAFWDAFSGSTTSVAPVGNGLQKNWDAEKVRKVLEGKAVVRVVDVEDLGKLSGSRSLTKSASTSALKSSASSSTVSLEESMKAMTLTDVKKEESESCPKAFLKSLVSREQH